MKCWLIMRSRFFYNDFKESVDELGNLVNQFESKPNKSRSMKVKRKIREIYLLCKVFKETVESDLLKELNKK